MTRRTWVGIVAAAVLAAAAGCGPKYPSAPLQAEQTVKLTEQAPVHALVLDPQARQYVYQIEVTADKPMDVSFVVGTTVDEAVNLERRLIPKMQAYGKAKAKQHAWEGTIGANVRAVLVLRHNEQAGPTTVTVKRTK
jgi:hypothetical protein